MFFFFLPVVDKAIPHAVKGEYDIFLVIALTAGLLRPCKLEALQINASFNSFYSFISLQVFTVFVLVCSPTYQRFPLVCLQFAASSALRCVQTKSNECDVTARNASVMSLDHKWIIFLISALIALFVLFAHGTVCL